MGKVVKKRHYTSPRWSGEVLDCSMPMTFDTYSHCSYNCLYCFSYFQKSHSMGLGGTKAGQHDYQKRTPRSVNVETVMRLFLMNDGISTWYKQFWGFIRERKYMQWGGLADPFDEYERRYGVALQLLEFFKEINYPLSFSTKAIWWLLDERYTRLFRGQKNWHCKFSIINLDADRARRMEKGCPSPDDRLDGIRRYKALSAGEATLRLRPVILGFSDRDREHIELIRRAATAGAASVSTEFLCLESRADTRLRKRYDAMSKICGFDVLEFYRQQSKGSGYLRLNYDLKNRHFRLMKTATEKAGMRFYVSDAHHKELNANGSCCGLSEDCNYCKGQFTEAIVIAREKGEVRFDDIAPYLKKLGYDKLLWSKEHLWNVGPVLWKASHYNQTAYDYFREQWNNTKSAKSPYKYFGGVLKPIALDENRNVIYKFDYEKAGIENPRSS